VKLKPGLPGLDTTQEMCLAAFELDITSEHHSAFLEVVVKEILHLHPAIKS
jgi:hypothetical protein